MRYLRRLGDAAPTATRRAHEFDALAEAAAAAARRGLDAKLPCRKLDGTGALVWLRGGDAIVVDDDGRDGARRRPRPGVAWLSAAGAVRTRSVRGQQRRRALEELRRLSSWLLRTTATGTVVSLGRGVDPVRSCIAITGRRFRRVYRATGLQRRRTGAAASLLWGRVRGVDGAQLLVAGDSDEQPVEAGRGLQLVAVRDILQRSRTNALRSALTSSRPARR